jgi:DNA-binding CsgD family transcriptional regulator
MGGSLLERSGERARIAAALEMARMGSGAALVVEGEPGIGKTALLGLACERAVAGGLRVLHACGVELEAGFAFGVVRQCLEPTIRAADQAERTRLFSGAAALAEPLLTDVIVAGPQASFGALHGLYWLLANLCESGPLLIAVDDAHWADDASLRFLAYLVRRVDSLPLALIVATRPGGQQEENGALSGLLADPAVQLLLPAPLSGLAVAHLLGHENEDLFSRACLDATGGNPFLLDQLLGAMREQGVPFTAASAGRVESVAPPQVARATRARLARLEPRAAMLARSLAVLGDHTALDLASELAGLTPAEGARAAESLTRSGLVEFERVLRFRHPLLRAAVDASITPLERDAWHRKAASLLHQRDAPPEQIAVHLLVAAPAGSAADARTLRDAAARAAQRGAPASAVSLLRRTLEEQLSSEDRVDVLLELGDAERAAGKLADAAERLREAVRLADDPIARARALVELGRTLDRDPAAQRELLAQFESTLARASTLELDRDLELRLKVSFLTAAFFAGTGDEPRVREIAAELAQLPGDTPSESIALCGLIESVLQRRLPVPNIPFNAAAIGSLVERAANHADELLAAGARDSRVHGLLLALRWTDHLDAAERITEQWTAIARRQGSEEAFAAARVHSSHLNRMRGRLRQAEADAEMATAAAPPGSVILAMARVALTDCLISKGDLDAAQAAYDAIGLREQIPPYPPYGAVLVTRAELRCALGQHTAALADYEELTRRPGPRNGWNLTIMLAAIESHHALGHQDVVKTDLDQALSLATQWGTPSAIGSVMRVRGRLAGDAAQAIEDLRSATEYLQRSPRRPLYARALIDLGSALRRAGRRSDAREPLRAGYELAREYGAHGLAETARLELAASGVRLRRERLTGAESLTASERRIADLAAAGASNAEIAQALFVTIKTVEMHLTHTYRKLDITKRAELPRALTDAADHPI